ncbi:MAG: hypothetical protein KGS09_16215 [Nitrospirae bacterium]|nr:hypothetical protein [Nitrospirota bacterium]
MKRLILIILLLLSSGPAYAEWVLVEKNNELVEVMAVYADPDTIRRKGDLVKMWTLHDFKTIQTSPSSSYLSTKVQRQFDCTKQRTRLLAFTEFSGNMGTGTVAFSDSPDEDSWIPVEPGSINHALWEVACSGPVHAEWVAIGSTESAGGFTVYLNHDTIVRKGDLVKMWALYDYNTTQTKASNMYFSSEMQSEYDCTEERTRLLSFVEFSGKMGSGNVVSSGSDETNRWISVPPGSVGQALWKIACSKK